MAAIWKDIWKEVRVWRWYEIFMLAIALLGIGVAILLFVLRSPNQPSTIPPPNSAEKDSIVSPTGSGAQDNIPASGLTTSAARQKQAPFANGKQSSPFVSPIHLSSIESAFQFLYKQMDYDRTLSFSEVTSSNFPGRGDLRFIQSFVPMDDCENGFKNAAYTYDQALVLLAFLARGNDEDLARAKVLANSLVQAQSSDPDFQGGLKEGQLRNGYASGKLLDGAGYTHIPYGRMPSKSYPVADQFAAGSNTGSMAWAALALVQAHSVLEKRDQERRYLDAAISLGNWIIKHAADNKNPGFSAGMHGFPPTQFRETDRPTRYNIDVAVLFDHLASVDNASAKTWKKQAEKARSFVNLMRNHADDAPIYWIGTEENSMAANQRPIALDVQTSIVLQAREPSSDPNDPYRRALDWALVKCTEKGKSDSFDFNCNDGDGAWWEGTAKVVSALRWLQREKEATPILARLQRAQLKDVAPAGAMPAASQCGITTGLDLVFRRPDGAIESTIPWRIPTWPHIGATAWFIFATLGINPYFVEELRKPTGR